MLILKMSLNSHKSDIYLLSKQEELKNESIRKFSLKENRLFALLDTIQ